MPRKIRELIVDLNNAGFVQYPGRGSHRKFKHACGVIVILSAHSLGEDAKPYQEKQLRKAIQDANQ